MALVEIDYCAFLPTLLFSAKHGLSSLVLHALAMPARRRVFQPVGPMSEPFVPRYQQLLAKAQEWLFIRQTAYIKVFQGPYADTVLADLAKFCRANTSTFHPDPHVAARLDGRREVFLRIQQHLKLDDEALWKLLGNPNHKE